MKLATTTGDFGAYAKSQMQSMEYIHQAGFRFLDYNFGLDFARKDGIFSADPKGHLEEVKRRADKLGVKFVQSHAPMGSPLKEDEKQDQFIEATKACIRACAQLDIPSVVVHSGYLPDITKEEAFERNKAFYDDLLQVAESCGVNVLVENFNRMSKENVYWIDNAKDLRELIDLVHHPLFHACWDAGHGNMQEMPQHESLRILGHHVLALHIQDNMGDRDSHLYPFCGSLNLDSLMQGLFDIDYQGYFTFESASMFKGADKRRPYEADTRLARVPLSLRLKEEALLYEIGKTVLSAYDCFEI